MTKTLYLFISTIGEIALAHVAIAASSRVKHMRNGNPPQTTRRVRATGINCKPACMGRGGRSQIHTASDGATNHGTALDRPVGSKGTGSSLQKALLPVTQTPLCTCTRRARHHRGHGSAHHTEAGMDGHGHRNRHHCSRPRLRLGGLCSKLGDGPCHREEYGVLLLANVGASAL